MSELLEAAKRALKEMCKTNSPRNSFTDAVDALDAAITKAEQSVPGRETMEPKPVTITIDAIEWGEIVSAIYAASRQINKVNDDTIPSDLGMIMMEWRNKLGRYCRRIDNATSDAEIARQKAKE